MRITFGLIAATLTGLASTAWALDGSQMSVVAPVYSGQTSSYLRLVNVGASAATFNVHFMGTTTGRDYGTAVISVPRNAAKQIPVTPSGGSGSIQSLANASVIDPSDTTFALFIENYDYTAGYQHVIYDSNSGFFGNLSSCKHAMPATLASLPATGGSNILVLPNVHSSSLQNFSGKYPETVTIFSYWPTGINLTVTVTDAGTGNTLGSFPVNPGVNGYSSFPVSTIESFAGITPSAAITQYNILISDPVGTPPVNASAVVLNAAFNNVQTSMSATCATQPPMQSSTGGGISAGW